VKVLRRHFFLRYRFFGGNLEFLLVSNGIADAFLAGCAPRVELEDAAMFEDSLFASRVGVVSASKRWTMLASMGLQATVAVVVITLPLLHPEPLPFHVEGPKVVVPLMPKPPAMVRVEAAASASAGVAATVTRPMIFPSLLPNSDLAMTDAPPLVPIGPGMGRRDGLPYGIGVGDGPGPAVIVAPVKASAPLNVSTGVLQGMLIAPIRPVYPAIAKAAGVRGTVIVEAIISRTGTIESLHVVSGPQMLQSAALDAIREARYQPYRLNGVPTEVETRITVNFRLGG
jgi:periplasmic protein TonB